MENFADQIASLKEQFPTLLTLFMNIMAAFFILIVGWMIASWIRRRIRRSRIGEHHKIDATLRPVIASSIFYVIIAMTLYAFLMKLGVPATSLLAVFGAAGLAIGLALKDTLSNIASGVMLIILRPLQVGEFVDASNYAGTVQEIGLFATTLKNLEGLYIYVPNSEVWKNRMQNFARHSERKFIESIGVAYDTDLKQAQRIMLDVMREADGVQELPTPPECYVMSFGDSAITMSCRCWLPPDNWLQRASDLRLNLKAALDKADIEIPFPQRVVTTKAVK